MFRLRHRFASVGVLPASLAAATVAIPVHAASGVTVVYRPVLINGQAAPGLPGQTLTVANLAPIPSPPVIDSAGRFVALAARQPGGAPVMVAGDSRARPSALRIVAKAGDQVPGLAPGVVIASFFPFFNIGPGGVAVVGVRLSGPGVTIDNDEAWLVEPALGQPARVLIRRGDSVPGVVGAQVASLNPLGQAPTVGAGGGIAFSVLTNVGVVMLRATVAGAASPALVAVQGSPVPGQGPGVTYTSLSSMPRMLDSGEIVAPVVMAGESAVAAFASGSNTPRMLLRQGDTVDGRVLSSVNATEMSNHGAGRLALAVALPTGLAFVEGTADVSAPFRLLAVSGTPAPGLPVGVNFATIGVRSIAASVTGRTAFVATFSGTGVTNSSDTAVFTEAPAGSGAPVLVLREGRAAPGLPAGVTIRAIELFGSWPTDLAINGRGQTLVSAGLMGTGVTAANDYGVWAVGSDGLVQLILREGSPLTIAAGDTRTISAIGPRRQTSPVPSRAWLNDDGEFIVDVTFTDTSRMLLVGQIDPPPCPADFNGVDGVTVQDVFDFLAAWFARAPAADLDGVGGVGLQDLFEYLVRYFTPCP